jgi:hypothetical protein
MTIKLAMHNKIIQAATRLHNFRYIVDHDMPTIRLNADGSIDAAELELVGVETLPVTNECDGVVHRRFGFIG